MFVVERCSIGSKPIAKASSLALTALPALYPLIHAIYDAVTLGEVVALIVGEAATAHNRVGSPQSWAIFVGPVVFVSSLCAFGRSRRVTARWWKSGIGTGVGLVLFAFSLWFTRVSDGTLLFSTISGFIARAHFIDKHFGCHWAFALMAACASTSNTNSK